MSAFEYRKDQESPALPVEWLDRDLAPVDFSSGYTFTAKVALATDPETVLVEKTSGITGAAVSPNVLIDWVTADFADLVAVSAGTQYVVHLYARRTADNKDRVYRPGEPIPVTLYPAPTGP